MSSVKQTEQDKLLDLATIVRHLGNNLDRVRKQLPLDLRAQSRPDALTKATQDFETIAKILNK